METEKENKQETPEVDETPDVTQVPEVKLPHELQGYGIEEGSPDFDLLDHHGKLPLYHNWIAQQPRVPWIKELSPAESALSGVRTQIKRSAQMTVEQPPKTAVEGILEEVDDEYIDLFIKGEHMIDACDPEQVGKLLTRAYRIKGLAYWNRTGIYTVAELWDAEVLDGDTMGDKEENIYNRRYDGEDVIGIHVRVKTDKGIESAWLVAELIPELLN